MRPIDADELKKAIGRYVVDDAKLSFNKLYENEDLLKVYQLVTAMPTIDAVPVIRCKDCKFHCDRTRCKKRIGAWFDDDYCNGAVMAERKEE